MKYFILVLVIFMIVGCATQKDAQTSLPKEGNIEAPISDSIIQTQPAQNTEVISEEELTTEVDQGLDNLETMETDLDLSDLNSLDEDLVLLNDLNF